MVAMAMVESVCLRVVGGCSTIVNTESQGNVARSFVFCSVPSPLLRASCSSVVQVESNRSATATRSGDVVSRGSFLGLKGASRSMVVIPRSALADSPSLPKRQEVHTVGDFMTRIEDLHVASPDTTVDEALEILVEKRITGLPVVDEEGKLVGVVSDYDLLALDSISGKRSNEGGLFPAANSTWKAFKEIQNLLGKTQGKTVGELMSPSPLVVREMTNIEDAARILLDTKYRRLPVVSESGKLVGLLTRGNVVRAALIMKRTHEANVS